MGLLELRRPNIDHFFATLSAHLLWLSLRINVFIR